jgi:mono/diheme cytochrome c family protein
MAGPQGQCDEETLGCHGDGPVDPHRCGWARFCREVTLDAKKANWPLVIGGAVLVGLLLVACLWVLWFAVITFLAPRATQPLEYRSNGEQVYFTATSQRGTPITSSLRIGMMRGGRMACVGCHGPDGRGGQVRMMMNVFEAPDIRYGTLISGEHSEQDEHEHGPWTDATIKQAIMQGVEPNGEQLNWPMPRWTMSDQDLDDLLEFLKTLD